MASLDKTVGILLKARDEASASVRKLNEAIKEIEGSGAGAAKGLDDVSKKTDELGGRSQKVDALATSLKALAASLVVKAFIDANTEVERFTLGMTQVTGSSEAAARELDYVRDIANRLGIEVGSAGDAWLGLSAATKGTALEGEGARAIYEAIVAQFAVLGRSSADVSGALAQVQQGISKGKFELEDLKSIAERMPGFFDKFAQSLGITTGRLFELISEGKVGGPEFLKFAQSINQSLEGIRIDTFEANLARLRNSLNDAFQQIGQSGLFDAFTKSLEVGTAAIVGATQTAVLLGTVIEGLYLKLTAGSNFNFGDYLGAALDKAADKTRAARDAMFGIEEAAKNVGDAGSAAGESVAAGMNKAAVSTDALKKAAGEVDKSLKALGIDPKLFEKPVDNINQAFASLATNAAASGEQIIVGLIGALRNLPAGSSVSPIAAAIDEAFKAGKISAEQYAQAMALIKVRLDDASPSFRVATEATKQNTAAVEDSTKKTEAAEKAARDFQLEMEKLASNERIKTLEFRAEIDVARIQADAQRVIAAFDSINTSISSTENVLGELFGLFDSLGSMDSAARNAIFAQLDRENSAREKAFELQKQLTEAQIENIRAQTQNLQRGDPLVKIDGAGLQPHLEAFMWEILRTIQVRVNSDGGKLLLGL